MTVATIITAVVGALMLGAGVLNSGAIRNAGFPHDLADLEGRWVLDRTRGGFSAAPPEALAFTAGSAAGLVRVTDGQRTAEFKVQGLGLFEFAEGQPFEPLHAAGASRVYTMTHLCPPMPAWDHLIFYPDGPPAGSNSNQRVLVYERE